MSNNRNISVALWTLTTKEIRRFLRIWIQTLVPPAGGTNVCIQILRKRLISLVVRVHKATDIFRLLLILFFYHFDK